MKLSPHWICWKPVKIEGKSKVAKVPYDFTTSRNINAHDASNWMTYSVAKSKSANVGFVLTENDPFFCIDLDDSYIDGKWSNHAVNVCEWFSGIYTEVSYSGNGLHLFGKITPPMKHHVNKKQFSGGSIELYFSNRFIAFSESHAVGNYNIDFTEQMSKFVNKMMPSDRLLTDTSDEDYGGFLTPSPDWIGPENDKILIKRMLKAKPSAKSVFDGTANLNDLWNANEPVLIKSYPSDTDTYDRSAADNGLFYSLAFWTGRDGPRIDRIARKSKLKRDKWDTHKGYLSGARYSIHKACLACKEVYKDPKEVAAIEVEKLALDDPNFITGGQKFTVTKQVEYFKDCVYVLNQHAVFTPRGIVKPQQFDALYGGAVFELDHRSMRSTRSAFDAFTKSQGYKFPKVDSTVFNSKLRTGAIIVKDGYTSVNTFIAPKITLGEGNTDKFNFLLKKLFPDTNILEIIESYLASIIQNPGVKFRWCPIIQGIEGNGKSFIGLIISRILGRQHCFTPQTNDIANKFNSWLQDMLFIVIEEIFTEGRQDIVETLKPIITNDDIPCQGKGVNVLMIDNCANLLILTNNKSLLLKTRTDRRYCIFYTPQETPEDLVKDGLSEQFFRDFAKELNEGGYANIAGKLFHKKIKRGLDPAKDCFRAPHTTFTEIAIKEALGPAEQEILDATEQSLYGFRGDWISSWALSKLLESKKLVKHNKPNKRSRMLAQLGYMQNPYLPNGRASHHLAAEDNTRPTLYIKREMQYNKPSISGPTSDYKNTQAKLKS